MLVDDDYINNFLNEEILREMKFSDDIIVHTSGDDAWQWLCQHENLSDRPVDIIFLDINMPGMDGFEFISCLHASDKLKEIPIVLLTTSENIRDKDKAQLLDVQGYLNKPLSKEKVLQCFSSWPVNSEKKNA